MNATWTRRLARTGIAAMVLVALTSWASAQERKDFKDFKRPLDKRGPGEAERGRPDNKLEGEIEQLRQQIAETNRNLDRLAQSLRSRDGDRGPAAPPRGEAKGPQGRPDFKGPPPQAKGRPEAGRPEPGRPEAKGPPPGGPRGPEMIRRPPEMAKGGPDHGRPDFKGPPRFGGDGPRGPEPKGRPPEFARGGPDRGGFPPRPDFKGPPSGPGGPPARFTPPVRDGGRGPSSDLEARVNRLERAIDELRREIRGRY